LVIYPAKPESLPPPPTNLKPRFKKKEVGEGAVGAAWDPSRDPEAAAAEEVHPNIDLGN
jgi:hypothetical protein